MSLASQVSALAGAIRDKINTMMPRLLPAGGANGQVLTKTSGTDYAVQWTTPSSGGAITGRSIDVDVNAPVTSETFTVTDAAALTTHKVIAVPSGRPPAGGYADQVEINPVVIQGRVLIDGQVTITLSSSTCFPFMGLYAVDYYLA